MYGNLLHVMRIGPDYRVAAVVACLPILLTALVTNHGIGISGDSVTYASTLRELSETGHWEFNALFPPGLPLLVVAFGIRGILILNGLLLWGCQLATFHLALKASESRGRAMLTMAWVGLSVGTIHIYSMLWTEPLFCFIVLLTLIALLRVQLDRRLSAPSAVLLVILLNIACLMRYAGVALVAFVFIVLIWRVEGGLKNRLLKACAIGLVGSTTFTSYVGYNIVSGSAPMGPRLEPRVGAGDLLAEYLGALGNYALNGTYFELGSVIGAFALGTLVLIAIRFINVTENPLARHRPPALLALWVLTYLAFLAYSSLTTYLNPVDGLGGRLVAPIIAPVAILSASLLAPAPSGNTAQLGRAIGIAYVIAIGITSLVWATDKYHHGIWYEPLADTMPGMSQVIDRVVPSDGVLVSNHPLLLAWITGRDLIRGVPDAGPMPAGKPYTYNVRNDAKSGDYLVWVDCCYSGTPRPREANLRLLSSGKGYSIYRVLRAPVGRSR